MATVSLCRRAPCVPASRQCSGKRPAQVAAVYNPALPRRLGCSGVLQSKQRPVAACCEKAKALESLRSSTEGLGEHLNGVSDKREEPPRRKNAGFSATASQDLEDIEEIDASNFYDKIKNAGTPVVLVDFYTTWCGPCKLIYPTLLEMKEDLAGKVTFYKFNCTKANKAIGQALDIKVAPTFLIFKEEKEFNRLTGAKIPPLEAALAEAIA